MSDAVPLPPRPNLPHYRHLARALQRACRAKHPEAIRAWARRWLERITVLRGEALTAATREAIDREAERMVRRWNTLAASKRRVACMLADAQFFIAREHGFTSWPKFALHVEALTQPRSPVSTFEAAADAIATGELNTLKGLLRDHPRLVHERSTRDHRSTLLHYVSANGIEDFRQKTPGNIVEITRTLLTAGADVNAESDAYGGGCTTLGLAATSLHPQQAGVQIPLLQTLLDHGARLDQPSAGGNGQSVIKGCLANGQPQAAAFLASQGAAIDFEDAAALGRLDLVESHFTHQQAGQGDALEGQLESAFGYACGYGREDVVDFLLEKGIDSRSHDVRESLHWAVYGLHAGIVRRLLERGWPVDIRNEDHRATPLEVALHVWARSTDRARRERAHEIVALLTAAGARLDPDSLQEHPETRRTMDAIRADPRMLAAIRTVSIRST